MSAVGAGPETPRPAVQSAAIEPEEFLDTNILLRYFIQENPTLTARAMTLIESERALRISVVTLAEVGFVLTKFYKVDRARAVDALIDFLNRENIEAHEIGTELAIQALQLCRPSGRVNFADALLWAVARAAPLARVWTFDEKFPTEGIHVQHP
jgi:predicted nucleic acid-binding protein